MELTEGLKEIITIKENLNSTKFKGPWEERSWFDPEVFFDSKTLFWLQWISSTKIKWVARVPMPESERYLRYMFLGLRDGLSLNGRRGLFTTLPRLFRRLLGRRFVRAGYYSDMPKKQRWLTIDVADPYVFVEPIPDETWNLLLEYIMTMSILPIYEPDNIVPYMTLTNFPEQQKFIDLVVEKTLGRF